MPSLSVGSELAKPTPMSCKAAPNIIRYTGGTLKFEVRTPETAVANGEVSSRGRKASPVFTGDSKLTAWARCGVLTMMVTEGKPMKKAVLGYGWRKINVG